MLNIQMVPTKYSCFFCKCSIKPILWEEELGVYVLIS